MIINANVEIKTVEDYTRLRGLELRTLNDMIDSEMNEQFNRYKASELLRLNYN